MFHRVFERGIGHETLVDEHPQDNAGGVDSVSSLGKKLVRIFEVDKLLQQLKGTVKLLVGFHASLGIVHAKMAPF
jgi:hypothetical protein